MICSQDHVEGLRPEGLRHMNFVLAAGSEDAFTFRRGKSGGRGRRTPKRPCSLRVDWQEQVEGLPEGVSYNVPG
jgi:hypothetical protein